MSFVAWWFYCITLNFFTLGDQLHKFHVYVAVSLLMTATCHQHLFKSSGCDQGSWASVSSCSYVAISVCVCRWQQICDVSQFITVNRRVITECMWLWTWSHSAAHWLSLQDLIGSDHRRGLHLQIKHLKLYKFIIMLQFLLVWLQHKRQPRNNFWK